VRGRVISEKHCPFITKTKIIWFLACAILSVYWEVSSYTFINYDDPFFTYNNPHISCGIGWRSLAWDFTSLNGGTAYYQPLVWATHQLDFELFGSSPGPMHLVNVWFHIGNAILLFIFLEGASNRIWPSAIVSALFALHPLHVESVAWISERKTLVCTCFWLLGLIAYLKYARSRKSYDYLLVVFLFIDCLMSKPIGVAFPVTLLLIDFWPLQRAFGVVNGHAAEGRADVASSVKRRSTLLLWEKAPLFGLSAVGALLAFLAQEDLHAVKSLSEVPLGLRVCNSTVSCGVYLRKMLWPSDLAPIYPLRRSFSEFEVILWGACLILITVLAFWRIEKQPFLLFGWLWYLATLFPTLGVVQVGSQGMADRYTYVPLIGIFIAIVWAFSDWANFAKDRMSIITIGLVVGALAWTTRATVEYWQSSIQLFEHAIRVTKDNYIAYRQLGLALNARAEFGNAVGCFKKSLELEPRQAQTEMFLAEALQQIGDSEQAIKHYLTGIQLNPMDPTIHSRLAELLARSNDLKFRDMQMALREAQLSCEKSQYLRRDLVIVLYRIYLEAGMIEEAGVVARRIVTLSVGRDETEQAQGLLARAKQLKALREQSTPRPPVNVQGR
jgi:tetratricopeptide (TPR) repeat protein